MAVVVTELIRFPITLARQAINFPYERWLLSAVGNKPKARTGPSLLRPPRQKSIPLITANGSSYTATTERQFSSLSHSALTRCDGPKAISRICPGSQPPFSHCVYGQNEPQPVPRKKSSLISSRGVKNRPMPGKNTINCLEEFYSLCVCMCTHLAPATASSIII
jgi:hypothetical protein